MRSFRSETSNNASVLKTRAMLSRPQSRRLFSVVGTILAVLVMAVGETCTALLFESTTTSAFLPLARYYRSTSNVAAATTSLSPLFWRRMKYDVLQQKQQSRYTGIVGSMTAIEEDGNKKKEELVVENAETASRKNDSAKRNDAENYKPERSKGLTRTLFLFVPLLPKFVIVLIIKFLTDLVVFPLLLAYRFARLSKRKILRFLGSGGSETKSKSNTLDGVYPNGSGKAPDLAP